MGGSLNRLRERSVASLIDVNVLNRVVRGRKQPETRTIQIVSDDSLSCASLSDMWRNNLDVNGLGDGVVSNHFAASEGQRRVVNVHVLDRDVVAVVKVKAHLQCSED